MRTMKKSRTWTNALGTATVTLEVTVGDRPATHWDTREVVNTPTRVSFVGAVKEGWHANSGQCQDTVRRLFRDDPDAVRVCDLWDRWHLNDLRGNCKHQKDLGWDTGKSLTVYHWRVKPEVWDAQRAVHARAAAALKAGQTHTPTPEEVRVVNLLGRATTHTPEPPSGDYLPAAPLHKSDATRATETKLAGWTYPSEHPDGLLMKACPACGYQYGHAWLYEPVPEDVKAELGRLFGV